MIFLEKMKSALTPNYLTIIFFIVIIASQMISADRIATTKDGKKVILRDDGTWEYTTFSDTVTIGNARKASSTNETKSSTPEKHSSRAVESLIDVLQQKKYKDFRDVNWGMTLAQVKEIEKLKLLGEDKESLKYDFVLLGMKCYVIYHFKENKLVDARYKIERDHYDPASFNKDFIALRKYCRKTYGGPISVQDIWKNDQYKFDESKWGFAVSIGFLTRTVIWREEETKIVLQMDGENHKIFIKIKFASLKLK